MLKNRVLFIIMESYMNRIVKGIALAAGTYVACGLQYRKMDQTEYLISTDKVQDDICICVLSDLYCRKFGDKQSRIMKIVDQRHPDLVMIPGDLFDVDRDFSISFMLIDALKNYPVYFTSGNHDNYLNQIDELRRILRQKGVHVLEDEGTVFSKGNSTIEIFGMSDHGRKPVIQASDLKYMFHTDLYRILISHRPEYTEFYKKADCDLVVSGHVHGGQWRIPLMKRGMYAPQQGLFPEYSQGIHRLNGTDLVISRGLASGNPMIPRLYNNPEIVFIQLTNQKKNNINAK